MPIFKEFCYLIDKSKVQSRSVRNYYVLLRIECSIFGQNIRFLPINNRKRWAKKLGAFLLGHPVYIPPALRRTLKGEDFLKYDSGMEDDHRILIFCIDEMINVLTQHPQWMADGTFKIASSIFYQLYTIHALVQGNLVPCVYAILPDKREET